MAGTGGGAPQATDTRPNHLSQCVDIMLVRLISERCSRVAVEFFLQRGLLFVCLKGYICVENHNFNITENIENPLKRWLSITRESFMKKFHD